MTCMDEGIHTPSNFYLDQVHCAASAGPEPLLCGQQHRAPSDEVPRLHFWTKVPEVVVC